MTCRNWLGLDIGIGSGRVLASDDGVADRINPLAIVVDARVGNDGADDGITGDFGVANTIDNVLEDESKIAATAFPEAGRVSVAVNGLAIVKVVFIGDIVGAAPAEEILFDVDSMHVAADSAAALVATEAGFAPGGCGAFAMCIFAGHGVLFRLARNSKKEKSTDVKMWVGRCADSSS